VRAARGAAGPHLKRTGARSIKTAPFFVVARVEAILNDPILVVDGLTKRFGAHEAVSALSFEVPRGTIMGFLGPNGAGKSTTLKSIVGIHRPDAGQVTLFGGGLTRAALNRVGYLPEERGLYRKMRAVPSIAFFARLKGIPAGEARRRAARLLDENGLGDWKQRKIASLSKGMAQKVQILCAIAHEPDLVILDEPFSGLDPVNQADLERLIHGLVARGASVVFSTHVMQHAERLCRSIVLIARGRKVFDGTVEAALSQLGGEAVVEVEPGFDLAAALGARGVEASVGDREGVYRVRTEGREGIQRALAACVSAAAPLIRFEPVRPSLHDAFVQLVGDRATPVMRPAEAAE